MKKWTYLVVAGLLAGATPMLQSCVDNDEPEGINVLRKAKAELIAAKKIVQEAEAARLKAEAAKLEADAALVKAQAEIAKAKAELINAKTEEKRAEIEIRIAQAKAEAEHQQKVWEQEDKLAEVAYQTALAELAKVKAAVNAKQQKVLQAYIENVESKKEIYDQKMAAVRAAQRYWIQTTETVEANEANKELLTFNLQQTLKEEQAWVESLKEFIQYTDEEIAAASALKPGDNAVRCEELQAEYEALQAKIAEAQQAYDVAYAELAPQRDEVAQLEAAAEEIRQKEIKIEEFKYEFPRYIVNAYQEEVTIVNEGSYSLAYTYWYEDAKANLESAIEAIKNAARNENQDAWNNEDLANSRYWAEYYKVYAAETKAHWQDAVNAYRTGTENGTLKNLKQIVVDEDNTIPGYDELEPAIKAYNDLVEPYNTALDEYNTFVAENNLTAINTAYQEQRNEANKAFNAEYANQYYDWESGTFKSGSKVQALQALQDAYNEQDNIYDYEIDALFAKYDELALAVDQKGANASDEEKKARDDAKKAWEDKIKEQQNASNKFNGYTDAEGYHKGTYEVAQEKLAAEKALAQKQLATKLAEIDLAEQKAIKEYYANYEAQFTALRDAKDAALASLQEAYDEAQAIYSSLYERATGRYNVLYYALRNAFRDAMNYGVAAEKVEDFEDLDNVSKNQVRNHVRNLSRQLYGSTDDTNMDADRLVELTKEDIDAQIEKVFHVRPWEISWYYTYFGVYGIQLYYETELARAEALYGVTDAQLEALVADIQAEADKLDKAFADAEAAYDEAVAAAEEKQAEIDEALAELQAVIDGLQKDANYLKEVLMVYVGYAQGELTQEMIDEIVLELSTIKVELEEELVEYEYAVKVAEKALADWNNNAIEAADAAKVLLDEAQAEAEVAKENLDIATERLQKAIEAMAVAAE